MQTQAILYLNSWEGLLVLLEQPMDFQSIVVEFLSVPELSACVSAAETIS